MVITPTSSPAASSSHTTSGLTPIATPLLGMALGAAVFIACILGTLTRPAGLLAAFWPANAVLLGLLLRHPSLGRSFIAWLSASVAFLLSSILMGDAWDTALWLSSANLTGVCAGWWLFKHLGHELLTLQRQSSALILFCVCTLASLAATVVGCGVSALIEPTTTVTNAAMWFTTELLNYMLIVPVILSAPARNAAFFQWRHYTVWDAVPLLAIIAAEIAAYFVGGPGALVFSAPALLWYALRYSVFTTSLVCLLVCFVKIAVASYGASALTLHQISDINSLRMGLTMLLLGPLTVACSQAARSELLRRLNHAAHHDSLTGLLSRGAFLEQGERVLRRLIRDKRGTAILMLDLDHFKRVNDEHGHACGDEVLRSFAHLLRNALRPQDIVGRLGGEEFGVVLPSVLRSEALSVADRICHATRNHPFLTRKSQPLPTTVSIGVVYVSKLQEIPETTSVSGHMDVLLHVADEALYSAKHAGRNRVVMVDDQS